MTRKIRLKRLRFRAWHRGTREADLMVGGFFDANCNDWNDAEIDWFEQLMDEQDVDIMAWAMGTSPPPARLDGALLRAMQRLDYIPLPE